MFEQPKPFAAQKGLKGFIVNKQKRSIGNPSACLAMDNSCQTVELNGFKLRFIIIIFIICAFFDRALANQVLQNEGASFVQFCVIEQSLVDDTETIDITTAGKPIRVLRNTLLNLSDVERAEAKFNKYQGSYFVYVIFSRAGKWKFSKITGDYIGKKLTILIDSKVQSTPIINEQIDSGQAPIHFNMNLDNATKLAAKINKILARLPEKGNEEDIAELEIDILSELEELQLNGPYLFEQPHISHVIRQEQRLGSQMQGTMSPEMAKELFGKVILPRIVFQRPAPEHLKFTATYQYSSSDSIVKVADYEWSLDIKDLRERELARKKIFVLTGGLYDKLKQVLISQLGEPRFVDILREHEFKDRTVKVKVSRWTNDARTIFLQCGQFEGVVVVVKWN
ncbi:MAG: hypothetical protein E2O76_05870 [Caldithrix sp.]|nr:MAG: hypothetical protein E2O76_05870 [Caldithrix sp.]